MNLTDSMRIEATTAVELAARAWLADRPVSETSIGDFARFMAEAALNAALADALAREGAVFRPDVAELERLRAEKAALEAELAKRPAPFRVIVPGQGAA